MFHFGTSSLTVSTIRKTDISVSQVLILTRRFSGWWTRYTHQLQITYRLWWLPKVTKPKISKKCMAYALLNIQTILWNDNSKLYKAGSWDILQERKEKNTNKNSGSRGRNRKRCRIYIVLFSKFLARIVCQLVVQHCGDISQFMFAYGKKA